MRHSTSKVGETVVLIRLAGWPDGRTYFIVVQLSVRLTSTAQWADCATRLKCDSSISSSAERRIRGGRFKWKWSRIRGNLPSGQTRDASWKESALTLQWSTRCWRLFWKIKENALQFSSFFSLAFGLLATGNPLRARAIQPLGPVLVRCHFRPQPPISAQNTRKPLDERKERRENIPSGMASSRIPRRIYPTVQKLFRESSSPAATQWHSETSRKHAPISSQLFQSPQDYRVQWAWNSNRCKFHQFDVTGVKLKFRIWLRNNNKESKAF